MSPIVIGEEHVGTTLADRLREDSPVVGVTDPRNRDTFEDRVFITVSTADALAGVIEDAVDTDRNRRHSSVEPSP